jgi:DHA2 family multidrug resistance protein-like MFS transporter
MAGSSVNMFRQLGSVLGPSIMGTLVTTRFPRNLQQRLVEAGIPDPEASRITAAAAAGGSPTSLPPQLARTVTTSAAGAFTDAVHLGLLVGGVVLLAMAVPAAVFIRHRNDPAG